jgi:surface carbohydrate biosynthesis protein
MVVPYKARDLEGCALVGYFLERRYGVQVVYSNAYHIEHKLRQHAPDALILDHLTWDFKAAQARLAKGYGMKLVILPTEGLFQSKEEVLPQNGSFHNAIGLIDSYLSWGYFQQEGLLESGEVTDRQVPVVGCPRFDVYSEPYLSLIESRAEFCRRLGVRKPEGRVILWATNTPYVGEKIEDTLKRYTTKSGWTEEGLRGLLEDGVRQFKTHSEIVLELARRHPEWNFVIKIHPAEQTEPYLPLVQGTENVYLAYNAPIRAFLYHCDVLLQRNCTTATEAWMLGKPVIQIEGAEFSYQAREEYKAGSHVVNTVEETEAAIQRYLNGASILEAAARAQDAFIRDFYYRIDGKAGERAAAQIHELLSPPSYTDADQDRTRENVRQAEAAWKRAEDARPVNRLKDALRIPRGTSVRVFKRLKTRLQAVKSGGFVAEPEITPEMVREVYARFDAAVPGRGAPEVVEATAR